MSRKRRSQTPGGVAEDECPGKGVHRLLGVLLGKTNVPGRPSETPEGDAGLSADRVGVHPAQRVLVGVGWVQHVGRRQGPASTTRVCLVIKVKAQGHLRDFHSIKSDTS